MLLFPLPSLSEIRHLYISAIPEVTRYGPLYNSMISKWKILEVILLLTEVELISSHAINYFYRLYVVKWFQVSLFNTDDSSQLYLFICTREDFSKYCLIIPMIQFLHTVRQFQVFLSNTNDSTITNCININHLFADT